MPRRSSSQATYRALHELAVATGGAVEPAALAHTVVDHARRLLKADHAAFFAVAGGGRCLRTVTWEGVPALEVGPGPSATWRAFTGGAPVVRNGTRGANHRDVLESLGATSRMAGPLIHDGMTLGVISLVARPPRRFGTADRRLLAQLLAQVAPRFAAVSDAEERARRNQELAALHELAVRVGGSTTAEEIARAAVQTATDLLGDSATLRVWDAEREELVVLHDTAPELPYPYRPPAGGVARVAFATGLTTVRQAGEQEAGDDEGALSVAVVPLMAGDRPVGTLGVRAERGGEYGPAAMRLLELIAAQVAPALASASAAAERERVNRTLGFLHAQAVTSGGILDPAQLADRVAHAAAELIGCDAGGVAWMTPGGELVLVADTGLDLPGASAPAIPEGLLATAFRERRTIRADDYGALFGAARLPGMTIASALAVPLVVGDQAIGALGVRTREPRRFSARDESDLTLLAAQLAPAFEAAGLHAVVAAAEQEARIRRLELQAVLDHAGVLLFAVDAAGRLLMLEGLSVARLGIATGEVVGTSIFEHIDGGSDVERGLREALAGRPAAYTTTIDGRELDVVVHPVLEADGSVNGAIGVATDTTDLRLAELARRENEAKSRFLAAMSHEFRTPLNAVLGFAQLLVADPEGRLTERQHRYVDNIEQSGRHLLSLINDILDISRVAAGQMAVEAGPVAITESLSDVISRVRPLADQKGLRLSLLAPDDVVAVADARRFEQVALNLLANAIKFTPADGEVSVRARASGDWVEVDFADSGIGIAADDLARIFDEFTQVESSITRTHDGTGLGLALSRRLAELMGGSIEVASEVGRGSCFTLRLPCARVSQAAAGV